MYYFNTILNANFEQVVEKVKEELKTEGFGILTEINVQATLKKKLNENFHPYVILGACNPPYAFKALQREDKIGTMLPCNIIIQQLNEMEIEVAAIDPVKSMMAVNNDSLKEVAEEIREKLIKVISRLT